MMPLFLNDGLEKTRVFPGRGVVPGFERWSSLMDGQKLQKEATRASLRLPIKPKVVKLTTAHQSQSQIRAGCSR
jgi:hypothetical protein